MKILVTGANGYIGMGVVKELLNNGHEVIATDFVTDNIDCRATIIKNNIFDLKDPYNFYGQPDALLHLAWRDGFKHNSINHILDISKHYDFISKMIEQNIKKVCVMGSMHEVGFYEGCISEHSATNPLNLYGISKNTLRQAIEIKSTECGTLFQWIRGYYIVGNSEFGCSIFSKITAAEKRGDAEFPFTNGINQYDFLNYNDFCMQVAKVVEQNKECGIINCCSGMPMKLGERVEAFIKENNYKIKLKYGVFPERPYDSKAVWGDNKKISKILSGK